MGRRKYNDSALAAMADSVEEIALAFWYQADNETRLAGAGWYPVAHEEAKLLAKSSEGRLDTYRAAGVIAVLSPLTRWAGNLEDAWNVVLGEPCRHSLPDNVEKAQRILAGEDVDSVLGGKKVTSFCHNIFDPLGFMGTVNDSWIADAFGIDRAEIFQTYGVYEAVTEGLTRAAKRVKVLPSTLQATVWLQVREGDTPDHDDNLPTPF